MASNTSTSSLVSSIKHLIPPLTPTAHKGQAGRIGVVGGSADYTGAPYFVAMSSMRLGADMTYNICEPSAGSVIKTYSPDLIVVRALKADSTEEQLRKELEPLFERFHAVVVGPGLGRDEQMQMAGRVAINLAKARSLPLVLDADGLWLLAQQPDLVKGYKSAILTPNVMEFARLCKALNIDDSKPDTDEAVLALSKAMGCTILQKGGTDRISNGIQVLHVTAQGGLKRCGGQGDILSGCTGTLLAWSTLSPNAEKVSEERRPLLAAYGAALIARSCSRRAFERQGRAMLAHDLLEEVGKAYNEYFGDAQAAL